MDSLFIIWFFSSILVFCIGVFVWRKGLFVGVVQVDEIASKLLIEEELAKRTVLYNELSLSLEQLVQEKDALIHKLEESLSLAGQKHVELRAAQDEVVNLLKIEQDKLRNQLAEEKKYSEQNSDDYRGQIKNLDQLLNQVRFEHHVVLREKEIVIDKLIEERDAILVQHKDILQKVVDLELKLQEADRVLQNLKREPVVQSSLSGEDFKRPLRKSIALIKELNGDNQLLLQANNELKGRLEKSELINQGLENKSQQLQYELVKSRAQLMGFEQICDDLKKKIERSTIA